MMSEDTTPAADEQIDVRIQPTMPESLGDAEVERITTDLIGALKTVYDPEIPVDIYELGLIYKVDLDDDRNLTIDMTLTAPGCPVAGEMPAWVENAAEEPALVAAMKGGKSMTVKAVSGRGTATSYSYSLSGISAALKQIESCK